MRVQVLPAYEPVPSYKTWVYLKRNELAQETGRTMFYTDAAGELAGETAFVPLHSSVDQQASVVCSLPPRLA